MNIQKISDAMGEINDRYVDEAINYQRKSNKGSWMKWTSLAACFALVAVLGIGVWQGGWFGSSNDIVTLNNGDTINFVKSDTVGGSLALAFGTTRRELSEQEVRTLFGDLPVIANAVFTTEDNQLVGFEGKIGKVKLVVCTSDLPLLDTAIIGSEKVTEVDGVSVTAGYTDSKSKQTAIYYATFELGSCTIYVENAGAKAEREAVKNELVSIIQRLIEIGEFDLLQFQE